MKLLELKQLLAQRGDGPVRFTLPNGREVPAAFHVTEVGQVSKVFIDCGGMMHSSSRCVLQLWLGDDSTHRLKADKFAQILELSRSVVASEELEVEVEYQDEVISQYPVADSTISGDTLVLHLGSKHTDCLARHLCLPSATQSADACCAPASTCC